MLPPPELLHRDDGAVSFKSLAVVLILSLALMFLRPMPQKENDLGDSLGPEVIVEAL